MSEEESFEEEFEKFKADIKESNSKHEETLKQMLEEKGKTISEMIATAEKRNSFEFLEHEGKKAMKEMMEQHEKEMANTKPSNIMEIKPEKGLEKVFRLKTGIEGGLMKCYAKIVSKNVYHFGIPWKCQIRRTKKDQLNVTVKWGDKFSSLNAEDEIEIKYELKTGNGFSKQGEHCFVKGRNKSAKFQIATLPLSQARMVDNPGLLKVSINALIKFKGWDEYRDVLCQFDFTKQKFSDFLLSVGGKKFYVLKKYLAMQSSYFEKIFNDASQKPEVSQIVIYGVEAKDFQRFLEVLHGNYKIVHQFSVENILLMNSVYNGKHVAERCEEFLMTVSSESVAVEKKIVLASRYHLQNLLIKSLSEITNVDQIQVLLNEKGLDVSTRQALREKANNL